MNTKIRFICLAVFSVAALVSLDCMAAKAPAPAAAEFYPFLGKWHGTAQLVETGKPPMKLRMHVRCEKESSGYAVRCSAVSKNKQVTMTESDLMGVDPVTGQGHWYVVTNVGETHDHIASWSDANHMQAHYDWQQDGKNMRENISFVFNGRHATFKSIMLVDGEQAAVFSGTLTR